WQRVKLSGVRSASAGFAITWRTLGFVSGRGAGRTAERMRDCRVGGMRRGMIAGHVGWFGSRGFVRYAGGGLALRGLMVVGFVVPVGDRRAEPGLRGRRLTGRLRGNRW